MPSILVHDRLMAVPYLIGTIPVPNEWSILPDSYSYRRGESRSTVLKRMQEAMTRELNALWAKRQPHSVVDTREEALILASHVEKETAKPAARRMVAAVYSNRLGQGIPLPARPTGIHQIPTGNTPGRRTRHS